MLSAASRTASESLRLAEVRYRSGVFSDLEVLDSQRQALAGETDFVNSNPNRSYAAVQLYKALCGGWNSPGVRHVPGPRGRYRKTFIEA